jgi:phage tail-like protein
VPVAVQSASGDGNLVVLTLDTEMTPDVVYEARAVGISDLAENLVLPPYDRAQFTGFRPARPATRRFDLWHFLPRHNRRDDTTGDLERFIRCLQEPTDLLLSSADAFPDIFDLERAPEAFLDALLADLGNPFAFDLDVAGRRRLASLLVEMYRQKGTAKGIRNAIRFFLGIETTIEAFASDTLALGDAELGVNWILGPSDRFALYAFNVVANRALGPQERGQLRTIVNYLKPGHTHFIDLIEPSVPVEADHWELGESLLGDETLLH